MKSRTLFTVALATILLSVCAQKVDHSSEEIPVARDPKDDVPDFEKEDPNEIQKLEQEKGQDDNKEEEGEEEEDPTKIDSTSPSNVEGNNEEGHGNPQEETEEETHEESHEEGQKEAQEETQEETHEESNNETEIPENEKVHDDGVVSNGDFGTYAMNKCEFVEIHLDKRATQIEANNVFNLYQVLVTKAKYETCDDITGFDCPDEGFCQVREADETKAVIELGRTACDLDVLYLYPIPKTQGAQMNFEVKITMDDTLQCDDASSSPTIPEAPEDDNVTNPPSGSSENQSADVEELCATYNIDNCQSSENPCSSQCMWITCGVKSDDDTVFNTSSGCVPLTFPQEKLQQTCETKEEFQTAQSDKQVIDHPVCNAADEEAQTNTAPINPEDNTHPVAKTFGLIILSLFILFVAVVCIYRCQFRKNGEGPFNPPSWCPGFIFPRQKASGFQPINVDRRQELTDYEPPGAML